MRMCGCLDSLKEYITVKGAIIPNFKVQLDERGFKELTQEIIPSDIYYEQFDPHNCNKYNFMTFTLNK